MSVPTLRGAGVVSADSSQSMFAMFRLRSPLRSWAGTQRSGGPAILPLRGGVARAVGKDRLPSIGSVHDGQPSVTKG